MSCNYEDSKPKQKCPAGIPAWVLTFADLMSLLLAFFVLLFSFSEMDKAKYKQVAGSMKEAFGVQQEVKVKEPPKGLNIIAQEFSAGTPDPKTVRNEVRQHTTDDFRQYMQLPDINIIRETLDDEKERLESALAKEIDDGYVEVDIIDETIVIRILESGSFASGSTELIESFKSFMGKMARTIGDNPGGVLVAGHTDSVPISTGKYRSNWELSASRAVSVLHELMQQGSIPPGRFHLEGYGDTRPVDTNSTSHGRARNRRVEVTLLYDDGAAAEGRVNSGQPVDAPIAVPLESDYEMPGFLPDPCPGCDGQDAGK
jgi:chemotaxis protein MotB